MKANIHRTTSEDVERMKEYQMNRLKMLEKESIGNQSNRSKLMKLMSFPEFLNSIAPYMDEVKSNAEETE
jgi:hypothetical protein